MFLIASHSQTKYLHEETGFGEDFYTVSFPGSKVEDMWESIKDLIGFFTEIIIHRGANDLSDRYGHPEFNHQEVLKQSEELLINIKSAHPDAVVVVSGIVVGFVR